MKVPPFTNRWTISCLLTTRSELHIGDGGRGSLHDRTRPASPDGKKEEQDASTVCVDHCGRAYLPASGIKGPLRALVSVDGAIDTAWEKLFGSDKPDQEGSVGGKLLFHDAFHLEGEGGSHEQPDQDNLHLSPDRKRPWWNNKRKTCVAVSVSLDRRTHTAKENLLYHLEYVPAGETFRFEVTGENLEEAEVAQFLRLLDAFDADQVSLGGQAGNQWGLMTCEEVTVSCLDAAGMEQWKESFLAGTQRERPVPEPLDDAALERIEDQKPDLSSLPGLQEWLNIEIDLSFDTPWLIRDARQRERSEEAQKKKIDESEKPVKAIAILDENGRPYVPVKSLRGALRSQAEKILRTVDAPCKDHPGDITPVSTKRMTQKEVIKAIEKVDLAARLFGFGGWQGPLEASRLKSLETFPSEDPDTPLFHQDFVANDRFTGGAAEGAKFDAKLAKPTTLRGTLRVNLTRLEQVDGGRASLGLLALTLRDLAEGDIPIGSGSAKGQGFCHVEVTWNDEDLFLSESAREYLNAFRTSIKEISHTITDS